MGYEYDPELELRLGGGRQSSPANSDSTRPTRVADWFGNPAQNRKKITIFYNGSFCVCDVTDIQARAIICMARKETGEKIMAEEKNTHQGNINIDLSPATSYSSQSPSPPVSQVINPGLSMKRSLRRFLQKRKMRMDDASPYGCRPT